MLLGNDTPFAAIGFGDQHRDGMLMAVTAVRGSYIISSDGALQLANAQEVAMNDIYEGDPHRTPLVRVGDLIPYKPAADVTVLGTAYAPGGRAMESWEVGVAVGAHRTRLRVHGPRRWEPTLKFLKPTWKLGSPEPVTSVPLDYRLAAGGRFVGEPDGAVDRRNPLGPGILHADWSRFGTPLRAPQIDAAQAPVDDPFDTPRPQGFGPIPPFWQWRESHLGTRDEAWARDRCPQMPVDLSYRFFQTAHPNLILPRLVGDEIVRLDGLVPGGGSLAFALPDVAIVAHHQWLDGREVDARLTLDGLHLDLRAPEGPWRADLTWRGWVTQCPAYHGASLVWASLEATAGLPTQGEYGLALEEVAT
ncbi:hypothetical protein RHAL1_00944 [Beijerinckiaceae bacterium RH AL1]|nr:DUF2169 domain-containing protein [Beijerinckiaceae bacterium]VVB43858.1 hypothetical protein RHCH11_RHCH11_00918 [Beijerinckiaceae bacterium RH CH11]VVB43890.1 hypothetical protein RHAL8_00917 [Beijerinckiaceae bacterium RH AL8]VVC54051.1 hypothetical protein RHAL1_00944 [Beijerinckiaceae bacterium RH AL1]